MKQSYLAAISRLPEKPKQAIEDYVAELEKRTCNKSDKYYKDRRDYWKNEYWKQVEYSKELEQQLKKVDRDKRKWATR